MDEERIAKLESMNEEATKAAAERRGAAESDAEAEGEADSETQAEAENEEEPGDDGWETHFDPNTGMNYYHNTQTGATQWTKPEKPKVVPGAKELKQALVNCNLGGFKEALQDNGVATIYDLHAVVQMNEPRQEFLTLGRACGMTTSEISKLYKAARNSHQQAQQAASQNLSSNHSNPSKFSRMIN